MKYGISKKDMEWAKKEMRNPCRHDWIMDLLRQVYEMRKNESN